MKDLKFCVNCKHYIEDRTIINRQGHESIQQRCFFGIDRVKKYHLVTGVPYYTWKGDSKACIEQRISGECGEDGNNFEPKTELHPSVND